MRTIQVCAPVAKVVREIADRTTGAPPDAITLGDFVFVFTRLEGAERARMERHERVHVAQQARMAPSWARWMPERARVYLGAPRFYREYLAEHARVGYDTNKFEVEARAAE